MTTATSMNVYPLEAVQGLCVLRTASLREQPI
jgi:hypothetical protein